MVTVKGTVIIWLFIEVPTIVTVVVLRPWPLEQPAISAATEARAASAKVVPKDGRKNRLKRLRRALRRQIMPKSTNSYPKTGTTIVFACSWYPWPDPLDEGRSNDDFPPRLAFAFPRVTERFVVMAPPSGVT